MPWSLFDIPHVLPVFALVLFRLGGFVLTAPVLGSRVIPIRIRGALLLTLALMVVPLATIHAPQKLTLGMALAGLMTELVLGAAIGFGLTLILMMAEAAGALVGQQAGLSFSEIVDPTQNEQSTIVGQIYMIVLTLVFFAIGGHRAAVRAALDSFAVIPVLQFRMGTSVVTLIVDLLSTVFMVAVRMAGPVLIVMILVETAMGFLARTMPQLNILSVGFSLRVMVAMATAGLALTATQDLLVDLIWDGLAMIRQGLGLGIS